MAEAVAPAVSEAVFGLAAEALPEPPEKAPANLPVLFVVQAKPASAGKVGEPAGWRHAAIEVRYYRGPLHASADADKIEEAIDVASGVKVDQGGVKVSESIVGDGVVCDVVRFNVAGYPRLPTMPAPLDWHLNRFSQEAAGRVMSRLHAKRVASVRELGNLIHASASECALVKSEVTENETRRATVRVTLTAGAKPGTLTINEVLDALRDGIEASCGEVAFGIGRIESAGVTGQRIVQGQIKPWGEATGEFVCVARAA
jgi:hypothetical protein